MKLGAGIMQIPARSAGMTAMTAATLDLMSGGRFLLGLDVGAAGGRGLARGAMGPPPSSARESTSSSSGGCSGARSWTSTARSTTCR